MVFLLIPIPSDAAKRWVSWRSKNRRAQSIFWYDECKKGDVSTKQAILDYNEDDCRAMERLVLWLWENAEASFAICQIC